MRRNGRRGTAAAGLAAVLALGAAGCADQVAKVTDTASKAVSAVSSATASAARKLDDIKGGVDVKDQVKLGAKATDADGRTTVAVTVENTASSAKSFAVQVDFRDSGGNLLDTTVVTLSDVPAGKTKDASARSNRKLSGEVKATVARALRY